MDNSLKPASCGGDYSLCTSQWKVQEFKPKNFNTPAELVEFAHIMVDAGVEVFHCLTRRFRDNGFELSQNLAAWTKKLRGKSTVTIGSIGMAGERIDTLMGEGSNVASLDHLLELLDAVTSALSLPVEECSSTRTGRKKVNEGGIDQLNNWNAGVLKALV